MSRPSLAAALALCTTAITLAQTPVPPLGPPAITRLSGDLYKVTSLTRGSTAVVESNTVFLVTPDGIILGEPDNTQLTTFLKDEFARRFTVPVRYVLYSHYHWDHASGGRVFADTAKFVAHAKTRELLKAPLSAAPPPGETRDTDGDSRFSLAETFSGTRLSFSRLDTDGDGFLTHAEINRDVQPPDTIFTGTRHTIRLGDARVELIHTGGRHSNDMVDFYFPRERVLFAADYVWTKRLCCASGFDTVPLAQWIASVKALEQLEFDTLVTSHWGAGTKADLQEFRAYLEDLHAAVSAGIRAGRTKEDLQKSVLLDRYRHFVGYPEQLPLMVGSAYDSLTRKP